MSSTPSGENPGGWGSPSSGGLPGDGQGTSSGQGGWANQPTERPAPSGWGGSSAGAAWGDGGQGGQGGWGPPAAAGGGQAPRPGGPPTGELAPWGARVLATVVDGLALLIPAVVLGGIATLIAVGTSSTTIDQFSGTQTTEPSGLGVVAIVLAILLFVVVSFVYQPFFLGRWNGQTPGKKVAGCRVVRDDGQRVTFGFGVLREFVIKGLLFGTLGSFICSVPTLLNVLWPLWDERNEALHDKLVKTHVLRA